MLSGPLSLVDRLSGPVSVRLRQSRLYILYELILCPRSKNVHVVSMQLVLTLMSSRDEKPGDTLFCSAQINLHLVCHAYSVYVYIGRANGLFKSSLYASSCREAYHYGYGPLKPTRPVIFKFHTVNVKITCSRMTKMSWETFVTCLLKLM